MRAFVLHKTLSAVYEVTVLCFEQAGLSCDAIRDETAAPVTFFVDELLGLCSELTCLAVCLLPCEVAMARRCGAPVVSGRVPPAVTLWFDGRAGAARTLLALAAPGALTRTLLRLHGAPQAAFRTAQI